MLPTRPTRVLIASLLLSATALPALAQTSEQPTAPAPPEPAAEGPAPIMLVLDSSGSMAEPLGLGATRMQAARTAVRRVVRDLPADHELGLRLYGSEVFSRNDPGACEDSVLAAPIGAGDRSGIAQVLAETEPYGETPIGYALEQAAGDLRAASDGRPQGSIVLVSDGEPTCEPDPCEVARTLDDEGFDITVDVVGLDVGLDTRDRLACIAESSGGTYFDAATVDDLVSSLTVVATRAAQPYIASGAPVTGSPSRVGAPVLVAGDWADDVGPNDPPQRHYVVRRQIPGSTLHVSASIASTSRDDEFIPSIDLTTAESATTCGTDAGLDSSGGLNTASAQAGMGSRPLAWVLEAEDPCVTADELAVEVGWVESLDTTAAAPSQPIELRVIEEPPVRSLDGLPVIDRPTTDPAYNEMPFAAPRTPLRTVHGGSSFLDAAPLTPGRYEDSVVVDEHLVYAVDLDWGQRLAVGIDVSATAPQVEEILDPLDSDLSATLIGPGGHRDLGGVMAGSSHGLQHGGAVWTQPVDWLNRTTSSLDGGPGLAGPHYLVLHLKRISEEPVPSYPVPVRLAIAVDGDPVAAPPYVVEGIETPAVDGPDGPADTGREGTATAVEGFDLETASGDDSTGAGSRVLWAIGILAIVAAGWAILRRRSA